MSAAQDHEYGTTAKVLLSLGSLFVLLIFIGQFWFPIGKEAGASVAWRPATWTYSVAWALLAVTSCLAALLGIHYWKFEPLYLIPFVGFLMLTYLLAFAWEGVYHAAKNGKGSTTLNDALGVFVLFLFAAVMFVASGFSLNVFVGLLVLPLVVWGAFQLAVGAAEIEAGG